MAGSLEWDDASPRARRIRSRVIHIQAIAFACVMALLIPLLHDLLGDAPAIMPVLLLGGIALLGALGLVQHTRATLTRVIELDEERTGLRQAYDRARLDALRDGLTGLGNHRAFQEELDEGLAEARSRRQSMTLLMLDLDDLKKVNDTSGHAAGDELLRTLARTLGAVLRRGDRAYRIGGDEFAIILPNTDPEEGHAVARRILATTVNGEHGAPFSVTVGVATYPETSSDRQQLIHHADAALYWGKRHGRTDVQLFDPRRHGVADDDRPLADLASAVARVASEGLLTPVFQPIYSLATGEPVGFEGLVRPTDGSTFPNAGALFAAAESARRTVELDIAAARAVLAAVGPLDAGRYLSVNLSPRTLEADASIVHELLALARRARIEPSQLVVEITERESVEDLDRLRSSLATLRRFGVRIAADDVGAGNAGLRLLSDVEFDIIKVDLSLVRSGTERTPSQAVLMALQQFAQRQGRSTVAEGIETPEQLAAVTELGFDSGQGYLLCRPRPDTLVTNLDLDALRKSESSVGWIAA
jgi:diguanylate cyclase (GGDEF)-like protein